MQTRHYNSYRDRKICEMKTQNIGPRVRAAGWNISRLNNLILLHIVYFILLADERDGLTDLSRLYTTYYMCACLNCLSISITLTQLKPRTTPETGKDISEIIHNRDRLP